jgi:hypothetical protein
MVLRTGARSFLVVASVLLGIGCNDPGPTTPSGPVPEITRVDPGEVAPGTTPQTLTVSGQGFTTGLTVLVTPPSGARTEVSGDAIQGLQSVSFQVSVPFDAPGDYMLAVRLLSGAESNAVTISARTSGGAVPRVDSVTPGAVQASPAATVVTLTGANFTTGSTVSLTTPAGTTGALPSSAIVSLSSTSIQLSIVFATTGTYSLSVTSAQGQASNTATVTAFLRLRRGAEQNRPIFAEYRPRCYTVMFPVGQ